ncbi:MAG: SRPBCC domain-containing protein [Gaiellaceae bacterium]
MSQAVDVSPVVQSVEIDATPDRVFGLFTEPDQLVKWWPDAVRLEPRVGGKMHMTFEGRGEVWGEITRFEPGRALGFTWIRSVAPDVTTRVDVSFEALGEGRTRVEVIHTGWEAVPDELVAEWRTIHDVGWKHFLGCLADLAEGRPVDKTFG